jgi:DNA polymerase-3 subunit gamma/tau
MMGNVSTVKSLTAMVENKTLPHSILFSGPSGCGKTTLARILRKDLGCHDLDFKEYNCSDFRGIDTIREISRKINLSPHGECRVYLMDEVHQLSKDAQNAALKMLEDTPDHVYFFLCTTEPDKLIKTIRTRCADMPVTKLGATEMEKLILRICKKEKISLSTDVIDEIILSADGSARMALVILDKISHLDEAEQIEAIQARMDEENKAIALCRVLMEGDRNKWDKVTKVLKELTEDPESVRWAVMGYARAVLMKKPDTQAYAILDAFKNPFYDSKQNGLIHACYEAIYAEI